MVSASENAKFEVQARAGESEIFELRQQLSLANAEKKQVAEAREKLSSELSRAKLEIKV